MDDVVSDVLLGGGTIETSNHRANEQAEPQNSELSPAAV